ncbi:MAG: cellulase family glycosylhydrolase [Microbacteriaceae bacterium]|nr:cellulase family glycosylhydrolase [Microbacteriaceae bacterium]
MSRFELGERFLRAPDGVTHVPFGAHFVPASGPDWPWRVDAGAFAVAFRAMAEHGFDAVRIDLIWAAIEPQEGQYDAGHLAELDRIFDAAEQAGVSLHPTLFVGGEVGDAYWDLPWARGRNPHSDPGLLAAQAAHAAMLARRWRDRRSLLAWDLTDEPPFWIYAHETTDEDARTWTRTIVEAIRHEDPGHLITIGTASQEVDHGPFRADVVAGQLDFACVHPYPIYSPELYPDALRARRMTQAGAFEVALARGAGREVMLHEFGASSAQFSSEAIADYDRILAATAFGAGAIGFYAWCWTDAEEAAYRRAPYSRMPHETQFGLTDRNGAARPRLDALRLLHDLVAEADLDGLASEGPVLDAVMPVPHEYSSPYDADEYRLGVDSPYTPAERAWNPERSVKPLIRGLLNGYTAAARAGISVGMHREREPLRSVPLVLAPAPLTSTTNSLLHVEPGFWTEARDRVESGAVLYLSLSSESAVPELAALAGVGFLDRAPVRDEVVLRFAGTAGAELAGQEIRIRDGHHDLHLRGVTIETVDAEVLAVGEDGRPVVTVAKRGRGHVVVCTHPVELLLAEVPDAHGDTDVSWRLYRLLAELAGCARPHHPATSRFELRGPKGGLVVLANHSGQPVQAPHPTSGEVSLEPYGIALVAAVRTTGADPGL